MSKQIKPNQMYEELGKHYGVERGSKTTQEWAAAVKKAAGSTDSIEVTYERWKNPPKVVESKPEQHRDKEHKIVADSAGSGLDDKPDRPTPTATGVHSARPTELVAVHVHSPEAVQAQVVEYPHRDWLGTTTRVASWCQTMAFGVVVGVLVSRKVLSVMGF